MVEQGRRYMNNNGSFQVETELDVRARELLSRQPARSPSPELPLSVNGLSTTVANERLVEEVELLVSTHLQRVKAVTWRSRLSFLQTHEGALALLCCAMLVAVGAYSNHYRKLLVEVLFVLPFHFLAWYISFRLPRVEQLRAIGKVRDCIQRFTSSEDAFTCTVHGPAGDQREAVPPSSRCVGVLRDRVWRQIPYNMLVEGDIFKLRDGESFPCRAERLTVRPPHGAVPTGEIFEVNKHHFAASGERGAVLSYYRALSTACLPMVSQFLQSATTNLTGRTDTVFFEIEALVRVRLKKISWVAFIATATAYASWMARAEVFEQSVDWHLHRALLPFRLIMCLMPLIPVILLQLTDVWGNARIQSLFEWHAGLADDDSEKGEDDARGASSGIGEMDASRVPLKRQLRELFDILRQGLDGPSNLMHTLNSTTVVAFCDKEGLLTDTCTTVAEVCFCSSKRRAPTETAGDAGAANRNADSGVRREISGTPETPDSKAETRKFSKNASEQEKEESTSAFHAVVLDLQPDPTSRSGVRFEEASWKQHLVQLKPLGLGMALARQPRKFWQGSDLFDLSLADLSEAHNCGGSPAVLHDCVCNVSQLVGFRKEVTDSFEELKYCIELCHMKKNEAEPVEGSPASGGPIGGASPNFTALYANPHVSWRAEDTPTARGSAEDSPRRTSHNGSSALHAETSGESYTNFSQTIVSWFVRDSRDESLQMFSKAKPKRLLPKCTHFFNGSKVVPLKEEDKQALQRIVLQWKASGLAAVAFSYRPLCSVDEAGVAEQLQRHSFFMASEKGDRSLQVSQIGGASGRDTQAATASSLAELQSEQILLGMAGVKLGASKQTEEYAGALQTAGIRFQVYSYEGEKRTRTLGDHLGLETGWNCLISLDPNGIERRNMMGQVVLPCGIANIRKHTKEIDNVPLLVSLYANSTPSRARQMLSILQENAECVTCVGSALQPNFDTFRQANISVSVLVGAVPRCSRCFGRREPRPGDVGGELIASGIVNRAEFQLSADLTSLPCALQAKHSYSTGEQRTLGVLFSAIKEARRCVDNILLVLVHYYCGALQLAVIAAVQAFLCLPEALHGIQLVAFLFVMLPVVSSSLLFNEASPQLMKELPLKKADEKTLAQPGRLMLMYSLRSVPTALVVMIAFTQDLHRMFRWQVEQARASPDLAGDVPSACDGLDWTWWVSGRWPRCAAAMSGAVLWQGSGGNVRDVSCALTHAQQWSALLFVIYEVALAFTFLDRYDSLLKRGPASNKVLCVIAALVLLANGAASSFIVAQSCGGDWQSVLMPSWETWIIYVVAWPIIAIAVSEGTKRRDRRYHNHLQRTLRVLFNTRLGMWSPK